MIISKKYAAKLVRTGKGKERGTVVHDGKRYMVLDRTDILRTDHYEVTP